MFTLQKQMRKQDNYNEENTKTKHNNLKNKNKRA